MKPKLKDLGDIANILAAIGVIASLILVASEIRSNTAALRAEANLSLVSLLNDNISWTKDPAFAATLQKVISGSGGLSAAEDLQFGQHTTAVFSTWEQAYINHESGLLDDQAWVGWNNGMLFALSNPVSVSVWKQEQTFFSESFRKYVNAQPPFSDASN
jgi:hypothetical protein